MQNLAPVSRVSHARGRAQIALICAVAGLSELERDAIQLGGSARGYQIVFRGARRSAVPVVARSYDQSGRILYIAVLWVNVLNCRGQGVPGSLWR